jgi:hypothetical protein
LYCTQGPLKDLAQKNPVKKQLLKGGRAPPENPFAIVKAAREDEKVTKASQARVGPPETLSEKFEMRKRFDRSRTKTQPDTHTGLGLPMYCQVSSSPYTHI